MMLLVAAGCGGAVAGSGSGVDGGGSAALGEPASCVEVEPALTTAATMEGMAGRYDLVLVLLGNRPRAARGLLTLRDQPRMARDLAGSTTPLFGFTDVAVEEVSAYRVGDPSSEDATAPGVLVIEGDNSEGRSIILRLGSQANRRDRVAFDGAYTVLRVHRLGGDRFFGSWESGTSDTRVLGHFCAVRNGGERAVP